MARRKDGRPRAIEGGLITSQAWGKRPLWYTSLSCRREDHDECASCPACPCHAPSPATSRI